MKKSYLKAIVKKLIREALANKFGQGGDIATAENVANSVWGSVYGVMLKGEKDNNVVYRVTLHSSSGPVKFLKQDINGRWYHMSPPQQVWRPVNPAQVPKNTAECQTCGCGDPDDTHNDMKGDTSDLRTMDTANVDEADELKEMTSSGAVFSGGPTIQTPYAFAAKGKGSKKAMDATKKTGYKPAGKGY